MASIYLSLSAKADFSKNQEILIRFSHGKINQRAKTNIFIPAEYWDNKAQQILFPNFRLLTDDKIELKKHLSALDDKLNTLTKFIQYSIFIRCP